MKSRGIVLKSGGRGTYPCATLFSIAFVDSALPHMHISIWMFLLYKLAQICPNYM